MPSCERERFVGRDAYLSSLRSALEQAREGQARTVLIEGPAGIGKSALVERFLQDQDDVRVVRASGEQWEVRVSYGVVDQLMRAAGAGPLLPAETPVDVGAWLLETVEGLQTDGVVILVIEDLQWTDTDSLRAVLFSLRRLISEKVLAVLTVRDEESARLPDGLRRLAAVAGMTLRLVPFSATEIRELASARGVERFPACAATRLHEHTGGIPRYVQALLDEVPAETWRSWQPVLPAPRAFVDQIVRRMDNCGPEARRLVEAASALEGFTPLSAVAAIAGIAHPLAALDEAVQAVGLLQVNDDTAVRSVGFPDPLIQAAVHEQVGPARRVELHLAAEALCEDEATRLRHRAAAAEAPDDVLSEQLCGYARRQAQAGEWASAASALMQAARFTAAPQARDHLLLRAIDAVITSGNLALASDLSDEIAGLDPAPLRDAALGYLAVLKGRPHEAHALLRAAEQRCPAPDADLAAVIAYRRGLHAMGRLSGGEMLDRAEQSLSLARGDEPVRAEAETLLGLGYAWSGRISEGLAVYEAILARADASDGMRDRVQVPLGWLRLVADEVEQAECLLSDAGPAQLRRGSTPTAVWAYVWLSRSQFLLGSWDQAAGSAERAVSMLGAAGHEWLRALVGCAAAAVPAARGEWRAAEEHARLGAARPGDYELVVVASCLAQAQIAVARNDPEAVLRILAPVRAIGPRDGLDEPGFWPWPPYYGDALVTLGRWDEADEFLRPHEQLAAARGRRTCIASLAAVRGRVEAAAGRPEAAEAAFRRGLQQLEPLRVPFIRAQLELAYGQVLRRLGHRRAGAAHLQAARDRFAGLNARPYLARSARELDACGLSPAKRHDVDPRQLTAQELAVARLVGAGMSNREVAAALFISIKTVQFHLTHIYTKLRLSSRAELTGHLRTSGARHELTTDSEGPTADPGDLAG